MAKALFFITETEAVLQSIKIEDGGVYIGDKKFWVDRSVPIDLKRIGGMTEPLYLLKWDCIEPGDLEFFTLKEKKKSLKELLHSDKEQIEKDMELKNAKAIVEGKEPIEKEFITNIVFTRDAKNTPESLYKTETLKILGGMLKVKKAGGLLPMVFGVIIGLVVTFLIFYFKIIKI